MIVVDVNVVADVLLGGRQAELAQRVFERDPVWAAPVLWRSKFRSILAASMRQRDLTLADAWQAHELAEALLAANEFAVAGERVLRLVAASRCSADDCEYVALAEELDRPLVTAHRQLLRQFPNTALSLSEYLAR